MKRCEDLEAFMLLSSWNIFKVRLSFKGVARLFKGTELLFRPPFADTKSHLLAGQIVRVYDRND